MKELTRAEEQIMQILWRLKKGFVKDIVEELPDPKPAYNTVSTIVRILEKKGFVGHKAYGKTHEYFPVMERDAYTRQYFKAFLSNYFGDSFQRMVSFFARDKEMDIRELEETLKIMEEEIKKNKQKL